MADYETYLEAQKAVDHLSDEEFPVQLVTIVGTDLRMVERVTGRLTYPRVALAGAASGAWFGLFVGLLLSLFSAGTTAFGVILPALLIGAGFGMLFGVISYALTGGRRDFTSTSQIVASRYSVLCAEEEAGRARQMLQQLPGGHRATMPSGQPPTHQPPTHQPPAGQPATAQPPATQPPTTRPPEGHQESGRADG